MDNRAKSSPRSARGGGHSRRQGQRSARIQAIEFEDGHGRAVLGAGAIFVNAPQALNKDMPTFGANSGLLQSSLRPGYCIDAPEIANGKSKGAILLILGLDECWPCVLVSVTGEAGLIDDDAAEVAMLDLVADL